MGNTTDTSLRSNVRRIYIGWFRGRYQYHFRNLDGRVLCERVKTRVPDDLTIEYQYGFTSEQAKRFDRCGRCSAHKHADIISAVDQIIIAGRTK